MYTGRYPTEVCWRHDGVGEGPPRPDARQGRARAHPQRITAAVPRPGHQPHWHGPALRGGPGVEANGLPALHRQGRTRRRVPAPVRSRRHARRVRPHRPHPPRPGPRTSPPCAPSSRRPSRSLTLSTPEFSTHATTRKPSPRGSPRPPAKPAPLTPNSSASNWRCSSTAPRPAPGSSTPNPSPPPPPSPPSSSTTPFQRQPSGDRGSISVLSHGQVVRGDGGEIPDEPAAPGGVPGQAHLVGRDVADVDVGDAGAGVEGRGGQRQQDDAVAGGDVLEFLLDGTEDGRAAALPGPHLGGDVTPLGHRVWILEQMLIGEVSDG